MDRTELKEITDYIFKDSTLEFRIHRLLEQMKDYIKNKYPEGNVTLDVNNNVFKLEGYTEENRIKILEDLNSFGLVQK